MSLTMDQILKSAEVSNKNFPGSVKQPTEKTVQVDKPADVDSSNDALKNYIKLTKQLKDIEQQLKELIPAANRDWQDLLQSLSGSSKGMTVSIDGATLKPYTKRCTWEYPEDINSLAVELKVKQEQAKKNGTAVKVVPPVNPAKDKLISIHV